MSRKLTDFTGLYQVSHTLKFELRPIGKTAENLERSGLLKQDFKRAEDYPKVKEFLDEQHKKFLQKVLGGIEDIDWQPLAEQISAFQKSKDQKDDLEKVQTQYREIIVERFKSDEFFTALVKEVTPSKLFKQLLDTPGGISDEVRTFARFACYFKGYQENRKNIYKAEAQQTAAAYRAVNDNFTKFFSAVNIFSSFCRNYPDLIDDINAGTSMLRGGRELAELLQINSYNRYLSQSGIDFVNNLIGGINYAVNQYRQQHKEIKTSELPFMPVLYKQILSDRERAFAIKSFENDSELCLALKEFAESNQRVDINGSCVELFSSLQRELASLNEESDLFIDAKSLEKISGKTTGSWSTLQDAMGAFAVRNYKSKAAQEKYCKRAVFHLQEIKSWLYDDRSEKDRSPLKVDITSYWHGEYASQLFSTEKLLLPQLMLLLSQEHKNLRDEKEKVRLIKDYLDAVQEIFHLLKPLIVSAEYGGDLNLLGTLAAYYAELEEIIPLYNQVRNYVTKKATDTAKIKLMFNRSTLADGWDNNKEKDYLSVIFRKDDKYFLGIINPENKSRVDFENYTEGDTSCCYQKMVYKLLPGPNKMLPKVFFSKKSIEFFAPDKELLRRYKNGDHLKGENFDLEFCHSLIDFFKNSISRHEDWSKFDFKFSQTSSYRGIDDFYREVAAQGYSLKFVNIAEQEIEHLVEEGKLFLFQIWNKDFSPKSSGIPNKSTLYWRELFSPENLADVVFKLNGEAELFMRRQAIEKKVTHASGEKMVNRTVVIEIDANDRALRQPISGSIHNEIYLYVNGKKSAAELSSEAGVHLAQYPLLNWEKGMPISAALNRTVVKQVFFDMVKDKRFTEDKYAFHVPITVNFKSPAKPLKFNDRVLTYLADNPDVKIIGLDRGERNLIYLTLIDQQGNILKQQSLNLINGVDYHSKLDQREKERDSARKSWQEIGQIKDLKSGYLSGAVHEITKLMVKENAIVVMEELNFGFKRGRMKIEKQIYQKFEQALIDKLNYLVFKDEADHKAPGGVLNGYQLAGKFESFAKLGRQCGFIFYVPAGFTSKIDPVTGFINIFNTRECTGAESIKAFFDKFESIRYSARYDAFAFEFDYRKFKTHQTDHQNKWTVYSTKEAWQHEKNRDTGKFSAVFHNPTEDIKSAITGLGLDLKDGFDLLDVLRTVNAENSTSAFFRSVFYAFKLSTALRHSSKDTDKIISPVADANGRFFVSGDDVSMPMDADANGAFHIALKGLYLLKHGIKNGKLEKITNESWVKFAQTRHK